MTQRILSFIALAAFSTALHAQTLTLGTKLELNTLDPHFFASFPTNSSLQYFFDKLVEYGDKLEIRPALATNRTRYSNPVVDNLLTEALTTMDDELRQQKLERAINFAMADQPLIPVFHPTFDFAARKGLTVTPRAQRRFNAMMVAPK
jgi:ABC-type transport system substrate-binding protein